MSQWIVKIETTADGRYQWRHVPAEGTGTGSPHAGGESFDSAEQALAAGNAALARHHETPLGADSGADAPPETPEYPTDTRLGESQSQLQAQEDPRLPSDSPVSIANLPIEAQVRTVDLEGTGTDRR